MSAINVHVRRIEHQRPDPVTDAAAFRLHPDGRRHIETHEGDDGAVLSREWWWEPDVPGCDQQARPRDAS